MVNYSLKSDSECNKNNERKPVVDGVETEEFDMKAEIRPLTNTGAAGMCGVFCDRGDR